MKIHTIGKTILIAAISGFLGGFLGLMIVATTWSYDYDTSTPPNTGESPRQGASRIRETKNAIQERFNVDHLFGKTGNDVNDPNTGIHRQVTFYTGNGVDPNIYAAEVSGNQELFWDDKVNSDRQITNSGNLNIIAGDYDVNSIDEDDILLSNTGYLKARNYAGTDNVDLITVDANDNPVLGSDAETASSSAPTKDEQVANKKYVDDTLANELNFHWKGVTSGYDYTLICDGSYRDLNLSSRVTDSSAVVVKLNVYREPATNDSYVIFRKNGTSVNSGSGAVAVGANYAGSDFCFGQVDVECDENQIIEYNSDDDVCKVEVIAWYY